MAILVGSAACEACRADIGQRDARFVVMVDSGQTMQFCRRDCYDVWLDRPAEGATGQAPKKVRKRER